MSGTRKSDFRLVTTPIKAAMDGTFKLTHEIEAAAAQYLMTPYPGTTCSFPPQNVAFPAYDFIWHTNRVDDRTGERISLKVEVKTSGSERLAAEVAKDKGMTRLSAIATTEADIILTISAGTGSLVDGSPSVLKVRLWPLSEYVKMCIKQEAIFYDVGDPSQNALVFYTDKLRSDRDVFVGNLHRVLSDDGRSLEGYDFTNIEYCKTARQRIDCLGQLFSAGEYDDQHILRDQRIAKKREQLREGRIAVLTKRQ